MRNLYFLCLLVLPFLGFSQQEGEVQQEIGEITGFTIYPNPTYDQIVYVASEENGPKYISIFDVFGELVLEKRILGDILDITKLTPGVYMVQTVQKNKKSIRKLVVK